MFVGKGKKLEEKKLKMGSLFSGSGGFELAAALSGIEPVWASEVEPFPIRVTTKRFPNLKHIGDVSKVNGAEIEPVDVITFGSPCFPAGTLVLTERGYAPIEKLKVGDKVFTHKGNWKPISAVGHKESKTVIMTGSHYGLIATPNHPFYSRPKGKKSGQAAETKEWTAAERMKGKRWAVPHAITGIDVPPELDEVLMFLIGKWLGKQCYIDEKDPSHFCKWLHEHFGEDENSRRLPAWAYCMGDKMRHALLRGYFHGGANRWVRSTKSKMLAHSMRLLAETVGYTVAIKTEKRQDIDVYELRPMRRKACIVDEKFAWYKCRSVKGHSGSQTVYNITVEDDHSYTVEGYVVHNCQDLSVAGKRKGLNHTELGDEETTRSGLFMEAIRIIKEMREKTNGRYPTFAIWENVPGAYSSNKGEDFRVVLEELAKIAGGRGISIPRPPKGKWLNAGEIMGENFSVAWRTVDAQYWGVPQRRRRIYLVADFRGQRAGKIQFEREGLRGYTSPSGAQGKSVAGNAENGTGATDRKSFGVVSKGNGDTFIAEERHCALTVGGGQAGQGYPCVLTAELGIASRDGGHFSDESSNQESSVVEGKIGLIDNITGNAEKCWEGEVSPCLRRTHYKQPPCVIFEMTYADEVIRESKDGVCPTLQARMGTGGNQVPLVMKRIEIKGFDGYNGDLTGDKTSTLGVNCGMSTGRNGVVEQRKAIGINGEIAATLDASYYKGCGMREGIEREVVCYPIESEERNPTTDSGKHDVLCMATQQGGAEICENLCSTITVAAGMSRNNQPVICLQGNGIDRADTAGCNGKGWKEGVSYTLNTVDRPAVCYDVRFTSEGTKNQRGHCYLANISRALDTGGGLPDSNHGGICVLQRVDKCYALDALSSNSMKSSNPHSGFRETDKAKTLDTSNQNPSKNQGGICVLQCISLDRASFNQGINAQFDIGIDESGVAHTLVSKGPSAVCYGIGNGQADQAGLHKEIVGCLNCMHDQQAILIDSKPLYIVRRLTPLECCRLQGFPDFWAENLETEEPTEEDLAFWREVFETHRQVITGAKKPKTDNQIIKWLKNPSNDGALYKMWGNGICLQNALYVMQGISECLSEEGENGEKEI